MLKVCFPVQITMFWDCSGSFLGFYIPRNRPLTKSGHKEFGQFEYFQLYTLLNNPNSKLGKLDKKDLVKHNYVSKDAPDAISGETIHISNEIMVSGAAFTCYTLWNKVDSTRQFITGKLVDSEVISQNDFKVEITNINEIPAAKLALILKIADEQKWLRKLSIQNELVENINTISPLKSLIVSNYLNHQKYLYPEVKAKLDNCRNLQECFENMIGAALTN